MGKISLQENNLTLASFWYRSALCQKNDEKDGRFVDSSYFTIVPCLQLTFIYYKMGEFEKSKYYHEKAKSYDATNPSVLYNEQFFNQSPSNYGIYACSKKYYLEYAQKRNLFCLPNTL